jgi:hypothetical protein
LDNYEVCVDISGAFATGESRLMPCDGIGVFLIIQMRERGVLTLCEVEVYGTGVWWLHVTGTCHPSRCFRYLNVYHCEQDSLACSHYGLIIFILIYFHISLLVTIHNVFFTASPMTCSDSNCKTCFDTPEKCLSCKEFYAGLFEHKCYGKPKLF